MSGLDGPTIQEMCKSGLGGPTIQEMCMSGLDGPTIQEMCMSGLDYPGDVAVSGRQPGIPAERRLW